MKWSRLRRSYGVPRVEVEDYLEGEGEAEEEEAGEGDYFSIVLRCFETAGHSAFNIL